jgi:hypothetical protein
VSGVDATTWQALGLVVTLVGLGLSAVVWRRRGPASGLRGVAWSLLPVAAGLTGTLKLVWQIGTNVADWAVRLVFSPVVWAGVSLAIVAGVLFVVSGAMRSRGLGSRRATRAPSRAVGDGTARTSTPARRSRSSDDAVGADGADGMEDIEAILRKHGIS